MRAEAAALFGRLVGFMFSPILRFASRPHAGRGSIARPCLALNEIPARLSGPIQRRIPNQIVDRVLDVVICVGFFGVPLGDFPLDAFDRFGRVGMSAEIVPKQQGVALVGVTVNPHMNLRATLAFWLSEEELGP